MEYTLIGIDKEWWQQVKIHAIKRGMSVKTLILWLLRQDMERWTGREEGGR